MYSVPLIVNLEFISGFSSVVLSSSDEQDRIDNPIKSVVINSVFSFVILVLIVYNVFVYGLLRVL